MLANLGRPRRPSGVVAPNVEAILPDTTIAAAQLAAVVDHPIAAADLADLRRLRRVAVVAVEAVLRGEPLDGASINALAADSIGRVELVIRRGVPLRRVVWTDASLAAALARRLIDEVTELQADRLRRCARPECDLLFYDMTRSRTRRWHAEDPCGWRERQRARRTRRSNDDAAQT